MKLKRIFVDGFKETPFFKALKFFFPKEKDLCVICKTNEAEALFENKKVCFNCLYTSLDGRQEFVSSRFPQSKEDNPSDNAVGSK